MRGDPGIGAEGASKPVRFVLAAGERGGMRNEEKDCWCMWRVRCKQVAGWLAASETAGGNVRRYLRLEGRKVSMRACFFLVTAEGEVVRSD